MDDKKVHFTQKSVDEAWKESISKEKVGERASEERSQVSFSTFITSLGIQALIRMGELTPPEGEKMEIDLTGAQEMIELLAMVKAKTKGNLTPEEETLLNSLIADLQLKFVQRKLP